MSWNWVVSVVNVTLKECLKVEKMKENYFYFEFWAYKAKSPASPDTLECRAVKSSERQSCGFGLSKEACAMMTGCCWRVDKDSNHFCNGFKFIDWWKIIDAYFLGENLFNQMALKIIKNFPIKTWFCSFHHFFTSKTGIPSHFSYKSALYASVNNSTRSYENDKKSESVTLEVQEVPAPFPVSNFKLKVWTS